MIRPISVASAGYLRCPTKSLLVVTVDGYLSYCGPQPVRRISQPTDVDKRGSGGEYDEEEDILLLLNAFVTVWRK